MQAKTETFWREGGNIHVRSRFGSSNYTMLTVLVIVLIFPTGLPVFAALLSGFQIDFIGESLLTIALAMGFAVVSIIPSIIIGRLILFQFKAFRDVELQIDPDQLIAGSFKRKWHKVTDLRVGPATIKNFRLVPFLLIVKLVDKAAIAPFRQWLPPQLKDNLNQNTYGVWLNGRLIGGVFYDPEIAIALMHELANEAEMRCRALDFHQAKLAL